MNTVTALSPMLIVVSIGLAVTVLLVIGLRFRGRRSRADLGTMSERWVAEHRRWYSDS